jgi:GTPase SAR1 family protein
MQKLMNKRDDLTPPDLTILELNLEVIGAQIDASQKVSGY